ncbi:MAG: hypothetical protein ACLR8Y_13025 [Alistipes indistinctus]
MRFETLRELYLHSIDSFGPRPCFSMYGESQPHATLSSSRTRQHTPDQIYSSAAGLNSGDKIALLSNNMPNWGVAYFAATVSGMVIVPILPDFSGPELDSESSCIPRPKRSSFPINCSRRSQKEVISGLVLVVRSMDLRGDPPDFRIRLAP